MDIRIYVANLHAYNCGHLVGDWITLPMDADELQEEIGKIIDAYPGGEEWAIHDYEAPFTINEYDSISRLNELAERIENLDDAEHFLAVVEATGYGPEEALDIVERGAYTVYDVSSLEELAEEFVGEGIYGEIPASIAGYLDYEAIGRDLGYDGYQVVEFDGRTCVINVD